MASARFCGVKATPRRWRRGLTWEPPQQGKAQEEADSLGRRSLSDACWPKAEQMWKLNFQSSNATKRTSLSRIFTPLQRISTV